MPALQATLLRLANQVHGMNHFHLRVAAAVLLPALSVLAACSGSTTAVPPSASDPRAIGPAVPALPAAPASFSAPMLPPPGTIYVGAYVNPQVSPLPPDQAETATEALESTLGRTLAMHLHYHHFYDLIAGVGEQDDAIQGRIPVVSWDCADYLSGTGAVTDADIAAGKYDGPNLPGGLPGIILQAQKAKAFGHPIFLRYKWEMNLQYQTACANANDDAAWTYQGKQHYSATDYIAAWDHIRDVFRAQGANNVVWLFNPSGGGNLPPSLYYPGDSEVDWVGLDWYDVKNYYFYPQYWQEGPANGQPWTYPYLTGIYKGLVPANMPAPGTNSPSTIAAYLATFPGANKPLMITETGAENGVLPDIEPLFQNQLFTGCTGSTICTNPPNLSADQALQTDFPNIQAYIYWDSNGHRDNGLLGNYSFFGSGFAAYAQFMSGPYESATVGAALRRMHR